MDLFLSLVADLGRIKPQTTASGIGGEMRHTRSATPLNSCAFSSAERKQQKFKSQGSAQRFFSRHAAVYNTFNSQPHLISRPRLRTLRVQAHAEWAIATAAV